jgi:hypothetical protein
MYVYTNAMEARIGVSVAKQMDDGIYTDACGFGSNSFSGKSDFFVGNGIDRAINVYLCRSASEQCPYKTNFLLTGNSTRRVSRVHGQ